MKILAEYLVFVLIGVAVGSGEFGLADWEWWAWIFAINAAIVIRDVTLKLNEV